MTDEHDAVASAETLAAAGSGGDSGDGTVASSPSPPVRAGRRGVLPVGTVVGRYVLAERIGSGGMGTVYRAHDPKLDRDVAVKLVSSTALEAAQAYLEREAQAMAKLSHPNVAIVHDIGTWNGQLFIAMELCAGGSLAKWLVEPRPWRDVVLRFVAAGRGLAAAHRIDLVHRDFKPDNVLVAGDGTVKVSDFGLVRSAAAAGSTESNPDAIEGTPAYMAPEQLAGNEVDARADQFAFAVSVWEGVCGGRPFQPEVGTRDLVQGMLRAIRARRMMRATTSKVPNRVLAILERALSADPVQRWPSVDALADALERVARPSRKRWLVAGLTAIAATAATVIVMRLAAPAADLAPATQALERGVGRVFEAAGDTALATTHGRMLVPNVEDGVRAVAAYDLALGATGDERVRLKLASALLRADRCTESLAQLDTYLRRGGKATVADMGDVVMGTPREIDFEWLMRLKEQCIDLEELATSGEHMQSLAMKYWREGDPDRAVQTLEAAYVKYGDPTFLQQMGDIRRSQGICDEARRHYERFVTEAPPEVPQSWRDRVRGFGDECKPN